MLPKAKKGVRSLSMYDFFLILLGNLWNLPSAVFVGLSLLGFAFTCSFRKHSLTLIADLAYPVGLLGLTIGLVGLLQNISDYEALPKALAMAHIPLICAEKDIPFGYVPSQEFLAKEAGMPGGVKTASLALLEVSKGAQEKFNEVVELVKGLSS